jgi:hypothetical protein
VSQPDAIVPAMSNRPTSASRLAAVVVGMPWSWAAGMKWVPTSPLVVAPQIAKPPASNQKGWVRAAPRRPSTAMRAALPVRAGGVTISSPPYGGMPRSAGKSRSRKSTRGTTARAAPATTSAAVRQPWLCASQATRGRKMSWPVALPAVSTPVTSPRLRTNQRPATVATKASAIEPVPSPTRTPQSSTSCQLAVMKTVSPLPVATSSRAIDTTRLIPNRFIRAAANGAVRPNSSRLTDTANEMVPRDQPYSSCSGVINAPGVARKPAAPISATNETAATSQAGCTR